MKNLRIRITILQKIRSVEATAALAGATTRRDNGYSPWQPNMDSLLLQRCSNLYKQLFDREPVIETVHAGLECAISGSKYGSMDMICGQLSKA